MPAPFFHPVGATPRRDSGPRPPPARIKPNSVVVSLGCAQVRRSQKPRTESQNSDQVETLNLSQSDPLGLGYNHGSDNMNFQFQGSHTAGGHPQPTQAMVGNQACTSSGSDAQSVLSREVQPSHLLEPSSTGSNSFRPPFPRSTPMTPARPSATISGTLHHPDGFVPPRRVNYVSENSSDVHAVSNPIQGR